MFVNVKRADDKWYQDVNGGGTTFKDKDFARLIYRLLLRTEDSMVYMLFRTKVLAKDELVYHMQIVYIYVWNSCQRSLK